MASPHGKDEGAAGEPAPGEQAPAGLDDYRVIEEISRGVDDVIFKAHQKSLDRTVALQCFCVALGINQLGQTLQRDEPNDDVDGCVHLLSMT